MWFIHELLIGLQLGFINLHLVDVEEHPHLVVDLLVVEAIKELLGEAEEYRHGGLNDVEEAVRDEGDEDVPPVEGVDYVAQGEDGGGQLVLGLRNKYQRTLQQGSYDDLIEEENVE